MRERPLLFLDVDGVLNALGGGHPRVILDGCPCDVPEGTKERVARLAEAFDVVWATAWFERAHTAWRHVLDLPAESWPYLPWNRYKLTDILRYAKERPWAWVDDDAEWELRQLGWDRSMVTGTIVAPDPLIGLTDQHVTDLVAAFPPPKDIGEA